MIDRLGLGHSLYLFWFVNASGALSGNKGIISYLKANVHLYLHFYEKKNKWLYSSATYLYVTHLGLISFERSGLQVYRF